MQYLKWVTPNFIRNILQDLCSPLDVIVILHVWCLLFLTPSLLIFVSNLVLLRTLIQVLKLNSSATNSTSTLATARAALFTHLRWRWAEILFLLLSSWNICQYCYSQQYPSFSENSSETDSVQRKERPRLLPDFINKSEISAKTKSFEGLAAFLNKTSFKELSNKSKLSFNEPIVPRRQKFHISQTASAGKPGPVVSGQNSGFLLSKSDQATNKLSGLVATSVSRPAQIIRRHTLHDKSNQRQSQQPVHVHSWHRQVRFPRTVAKIRHILQIPSTIFNYSVPEYLKLGFLS